MVRIIERSTINNKGLFDELWIKVGGFMVKSEKMRMYHSQNLLFSAIDMWSGSRLTHPAMLKKVHEYSTRWPLTILINN